MLQLTLIGLGILSAQKIIELLHNNDNSKIISNNLFKVIGITNNSLFYIDNNLSTLIEVENDYDYTDIRPTDIVMDIGACIGGFSIKISSQVNKVYAIEPIMTESLNRNITLNNKQNIITIEALLGNGLTKSSWNNKTEYKFGLTLSELINIVGGHVDFLKLDCEGGEYCIQPNELQNIRRIEAEIHSFDSNGNFHNPSEFEKTLQLAGFEYTKNMKPKQNMMLIHAKNMRIQ